jgi:hypothetical protein
MLEFFEEKNHTIVLSLGTVISNVTQEGILL